ncbi:MAG: hypothetical protein PHY72_02780 [Candidatus Pacebacteria bacterium]|nr:hypothetical protein [Candidatus Paceibacterota bacterium]
MKKFGIWIISPSSYNNRGLVSQFSLVLMIPPIFGVMKGLINTTAKKLGVEIDVFCVNERLERGDGYIQSIIINKNFVDKIVFISAKTFELPRAIDIARQFIKSGTKVIIGGAGVTLADWKVYNLLNREGISFNIGEGEETTPKIIDDFVSDSLRILYWQRSFVDLNKAPFPTVPDIVDEKYKHGLNSMAGIDTCEGCPFKCSFCCVTTLRGREMCLSRARNVEGVIEWIEKTHKLGLPIMILDDNFKRSPNYHHLVWGLIKLNERLNKKLKIFAQVDTAIRLSDIRDLALAGIKQVFLGVESFDLVNLKGANKNQNNPDKYQRLVSEFHKYRIKVDAGWIIGWPNQTVEAIITEAKLMEDNFDLITPFNLVAFPGTEDYFKSISNDEIVDFDLNSYDTKHFVRKLNSMTERDAYTAKKKAFRVIYSLKHALGSSGLRVSIFTDTAYCRLIAWLGNMQVGDPYQVIMDGIPHFGGPYIQRPFDSYKGEPLTIEDLTKKEACLESI